MSRRERTAFHSHENIDGDIFSSVFFFSLISGEDILPRANELTKVPKINSRCRARKEIEESRRIDAAFSPKSDDCSLYLPFDGAFFFLSRAIRRARLASA